MSEPAKRVPFEAQNACGKALRWRGGSKAMATVGVFATLSRRNLRQNAMR